ncbi:unnamed protein product [Euphydryas editha]|uniref:Mutator-like transposase domain-containing protein n=1 Tax=Euphydryas editha TaxID=104508 RepID=A0AAU9VCT4_EUPED|nr:unnamed protein product [Euphydryas editha]
MGKRKDKKFTKKNSRFKKIRILPKNATENNLQSTNETTKDDVILKNTEYDHELTFESVIGDKGFAINGKRIVDFGYFFTQLLDISNHNSALGCNLSSLKMTKEIKKGFLLSKFCFKCRMCNEKFELKNCRDSDNSTELNKNEFAVSGFISIGAGYSGLEQVSASLIVNIPRMSDKLYAKCSKKVCDKI